MAITETADALLAVREDPGARWNGGWKTGTAVTVTYSFRETRDLPPPGALPFEATSVESFRASQRDGTRKALQEFASTAGFHFVEVKGDAMLEFYGVRGSPYGGWADYPRIAGNSVRSAEIVIDGTGDYQPGSWEYEIVLHEIGHGVGLKHPHEGDPTLADRLDHPGNTVMSYNFAAGPVDDLGPLDISALRQLYGAPQDVAKWSAVQSGTVMVQTLSNGHDTILGVVGRNKIVGRGGNDVIHGRGSDDRLFGDEGADQLFGGGGNDGLQGSGGADRLWGQVGNDLLRGDDGADQLFGSGGNDGLQGGGGADRLWGQVGNDLLRGGAQRDRLKGGVGNDRLCGDGDRDRLWGEDGRDVLEGGAGKDVLSGGSGADTFAFSRHDRGGRDRILDFDPDQDSLDLDRTRFEPSDADLRRDDGDVVAKFSGKHGFKIVFVGLEVGDLDDVFLLA